MNDLPLEKPFEVGQEVEVTHGPLWGIRGVLIRVDEDGRAVIRLDESRAVLLLAAATSVRPAGIAASGEQSFSLG